MYLKLLKSFDDMESPNRVNEDLASRRRDRSVHNDYGHRGHAGSDQGFLTQWFMKRRHRNVFHFKYASQEVAGDEVRCGHGQ